MRARRLIRAPGRIGWRGWTAICVPLALILLLLAADRIAAANAENTIATRTQRYGFVSKPAVTVEGFPFLTQLMNGRLDGFVISAGRLRLGPVTANVQGRATGVTLGGKDGDVITQLNGTGLIPFAGVNQLVRASGVPGAQVSAAGPRLLRLRVSLGIITVTGTASIALDGSGGLTVHLISAPGVPAFLIKRIRTFTIHLPRLPLDLALRSVRVGRQGVIIAVGGHNVRVSG
jgi:hypothetical protein